MIVSKDIFRSYWKKWEWWLISSWLKMSTFWTFVVTTKNSFSTNYIFFKLFLLFQCCLNFLCFGILELVLLTRFYKEQDKFSINKTNSKLGWISSQTGSTVWMEKLASEQLNSSYQSYKVHVKNSSFSDVSWNWKYT